MMRNNRVINRAIVHKVAHALGPLNDRVVFVGGAVVCLYVDDPAADDVRPTKDVDLFLEVVSLAGLERLREELHAIGLRQDPMERVICRFFLEDIVVDVMSAEPIGWAPGNRWFKDGMGLSRSIDIGGGTLVNCLPFAHFLATKFDAYHDRGNNNPIMSKDLEDIVYLLDNRTTVVEDIRTAPDGARTYLQERCTWLLSPDLREPVMAHMNPFARAARWELLHAKLRAVMAS